MADPPPPDKKPQTGSAPSENVLSDDETVVFTAKGAPDAKAVRPEDPTVVAIQLPRASSGHTVELGQLRSEMAKLLERVHQLEEGHPPDATPAAPPSEPAVPPHAETRVWTRPPPELTPRPDATPEAKARPSATPEKKARPADARARSNGIATTPLRPAGGPPRRPATPAPDLPGSAAAPATPPAARPGGGPATPPRPGTPVSRPPAGGTPPSARSGSGAPPRAGGSTPARASSGTPAIPLAEPAGLLAKPRGGTPATPAGSTPARSAPPPARATAARPAAQPPAKPAAQPPAKPASKPAEKPGATAGGGDLEAGYAALLADVLGVATVSKTSNFFDDLGADSMIMARFCAKVRGRADLPNVAMKDVYRAPTIAELAKAGAKAATREPVSATDTVTIKLALLRQTDVVVVENDPAMAPVATLTYLLCGVLQLLFLLGYPALIAFVFAVGFEWLLAGADLLDIYLRAAAFTGGVFLGTALLPVVVKWALVGHWAPTQFPVFGFRYFRFWLVKTLIRTNPLVRFVGTPLYPVYLRMLGAKIGKGATILSPTIPVCTDLVSVGAHAVIRKSSSFTGYRAHAGMIQTGPVTIGADTLVGEATVLDVFTSVGDGGQLGHTSSLHAGQSVPAGQRWHGNPAEPTTVDYRAVPPADGGALRKVLYAMAQVVVLFVVALPLGEAGLVLLVREVPAVKNLFVSLEAATDAIPVWAGAAIVASVALLGGILAGLLVMTTVPRLLKLFVRPNQVYGTYGISYWALRTMTRLTNSAFLTRVTGDSSYVVGYLKAIGYTFDRVEQTGSNFGTVVVHDSPYLCHVGSGTVVADGLTFVNTDYSHNTFAVSAARIGAYSFLGNQIFYPSRSRVGDDCLLATKVMVPIDGRTRHGVGLLGSPSFPIPRSTDRDKGLALSPEQRSVGLAAKDRHNALSIVLLLLSRWVYFALVFVLGRYALDLYPQLGAASITVLAVVELLVFFAYFLLLDVVVRRLAALRPQGVSIYDRGFWGHERYWKVAADRYFQLLNGTAFKAGLWRALGVTVGKRLFDDGLGLTERSFVTIGDHCTFNERSLIQCHSQENDAFKSDRVVVGSGVTVGVSAFIHYGTRLGDGCLIEADSFLMKGEQTEPETRWGGNPAAELGPAPQLPITSRRTS